ncbi:hypothetical protein POM88_018382 [Heracleum sosnowskyi]|uniref:Rad60/SUMO-like domain-containing protein n=1 Tax=Heracleum sosnowskyi TaxID=360622 RepID=A0AAD8IQF1_9APIA|nr:hypothetical protein POM88_018382 [Heracleum sosnowskyi]
MESGENSGVKEEYDEMVMLRVQLQGKPDFCFTMKRAEPLRKLMITFCERLKLGDYREVRFTVDGSRVRGDKTPNELELENDDVIDAWSELLGAGDYRSLRYHVNGDRVRGHQTPNELELENDDVVDAWTDLLLHASGVKDEEDEKVTLRVQQQGTVDFYFTMKRKEPLQKLMTAFCERRELGDYRCLRFHLDGDRIIGNQTPNELQLENCDVIDAWSDQVGGGAPPNYFK